MSSSENGARRSPAGRVIGAVGKAVGSRRVLTYVSLLTVACGWPC